MNVLAPLIGIFVIALSIYKYTYYAEVLPNHPLIYLNQAKTIIQQRPKSKTMLTTTITTIAIPIPTIKIRIRITI